mgnify:CR=1 FL=1
MIKLTYTFFLFLLITFIGSSQDINSKKLDEYLLNLESNNKFMGSIALLKDGEVIYTKQVGYSDIETRKKPDKNTKYRIGSISKTFTATMVFKAIEDNKLSLNLTLDDFFPSIINANKITINNLLNHRSGIHNFTNDESYLKYNTQYKSKNEMVDIITKAGSDFEPNTKVEYSNSNYVLLSYILETVYKKPYPELLAEIIVKPLNLKNTTYGNKINLDKNECNSYHYLGEWTKQTETDLSIPLGAGGIIATPSDLVLFSESLFNFKIISEVSVNKMKLTQDGYGMGLFPMPFYNKKSFGHTGGIDGFSSLFGYFSSEKCAFALTSNGSNYQNNNIAIAALSCLFNKPYDIPSFKTLKLTTEELNKYLGVYSSDEFPLKITISKSENILLAQATGQSEFSLDASEKNIFKYDAAGIILEFNPVQNQMTLKQGGGKFILTKE